MGNIEAIVSIVSKQSALEATLPWLSRAQLGVLNRAAETFPISIANGNDLRLNLCHGREPLIEDIWNVTAQLAVAGQSVDVSLSRLLADALTADLLDGEALDDLPDSLRTAVLADALDPILDWAQAPLDLYIDVASSTLGVVAPTRGDVVLRVERGDEVLGYARVKVTESNAPLLRELLGAHRRAPPAPRCYPAVRAPLISALPSMGLTTGELLSLQVGDVLCTGIPRSNRDYRLYIGAVPAGRLRRKTDGRYIIREINMTNELDPATDEERFDDDHGLGVEPDKVMLTVRFELGQRSVSVEDLVSLSPGQILDIPDAALNEVRIRANGTLVGKGELVRIGTDLGVQVMELCDGQQRRPA